MLNITLMYAWEKFFSAVGAMASSTDSLRERLAAAWIYNLSMILMNDVTNLPEEIQSGLADLSKKLHVSESRATGTDIESMVNALDDRQVRDAIDKVVELYDAITRAHSLAGPSY